ncbi:hypothetical protein NW755_010964 [Fusarium falciforme]|uniref:DUF985 domain-containing protein n=1 Tax=Fusarium falciforme TaxID=195108 RepID=A0A9W8QXI0_9HYPO|nr:hypothetical protein NW755_010964 [Fusarium falciforme]
MRLSLALFGLPLCLAFAVPENIQPRTESSVNLAECHSAKEVIKLLDMQPSAEKGYFVETFRDTAVTANNRSASTAIYYLLEGNSGFSLWHKLDAAEVWHYYAGAPLELYQSHNDGSCVKTNLMGPDIFKGQRPQVVVEEGEWQRARSLGKWTLVGTTVAPGFDPNGEVLQTESWEPQGC